MPWPTSRHDIFGEKGVWRHSYLHASEELPLGRIGDPSTPADKDRALIEKTLDELGPIIHVGLAPHPTHNIVVKLDEVPKKHVMHICDAVIVPKNPGAFSIETLLGDCASVIVYGRNNIGFLHVGRGEILDGLIDTFQAEWENLDDCSDPDIFIGPALSAQFHSIADPKPIIDRGFGQYLTPTTVWGTQGFSLTSAIADQIMDADYPMEISPGDIHIAEFCPYSARLAGYEEWASDRFFKDHRKGEYSPRDCAFFHFEG